MNGTASTVVLAFLLSTAYGTLFHLLIGGSARRLIIYIMASWVGFAIGHFVGNALQFDWYKLGPLNLLSASIGSWLALLGSWWLAGRSN